MNWNSEAEAIMQERFGGDSLISLATCRGNIPSVRTVNATYQGGSFYIITYGTSRLVSVGTGSPATAPEKAWDGFRKRKTGNWPPH